MDLHSLLIAVRNNIGLLPELTPDQFTQVSNALPEAAKKGSRLSTKDRGHCASILAQLGKPENGHLLYDPRFLFNASYHGAGHLWYMALHKATTDGKVGTLLSRLFEAENFMGRPLCRIPESGFDARKEHSYHRWLFETFQTFSLAILQVSGNSNTPARESEMLEPTRSFYNEVLAGGDALTFLADTIVLLELHSILLLPGLCEGVEMSEEAQRAATMVLPDGALVREAYEKAYSLCLSWYMQQEALACEWITPRLELIEERAAEMWRDIQENMRRDVRQCGLDVFDVVGPLPNFDSRRFFLRDAQHTIPGVGVGTRRRLPSGKSVWTVWGLSPSTWQEAMASAHGNVSNLPATAILCQFVNLVAYHSIVCADHDCTCSGGTTIKHLGKRKSPEEEVKVRPHFRRLPAGHKASPELLKRAADKGYKVPAGRTFIDEHGFWMSEPCQADPSKTLPKPMFRVTL